MKYLIGLMAVSAMYAVLGLYYLIVNVVVTMVVLVVLALIIRRCDGNPLFIEMGSSPRREILARLYRAAQSEFTHPGS